MAADAYLIVRIDSHPGCTWTDPVAVFLYEVDANTYLSRLREEEGCEVEEDGWTDSHWRIQKLPVQPQDLPVKKNYRWTLT